MILKKNVFDFVHKIIRVNDSNRVMLTLTMSDADVNEMIMI